ncbi:MAG: radical SAM protein [Bacteroidales bacterium]|nr:radical SAM protein [Bacteroidales bacterium]
MKTSYYNYYIPYGDDYIIYNGLSEFYFTVSKERIKLFEELLKNPDEYINLYPDFYARMNNLRFICDDEINEMEFVRLKFHNRQHHEEYHLMLLPTYQCNLRCWYCIQEHADAYMSPDIVSAIKLHIHKKVNEEHIKLFTLSWFGGEPLLAYDIVKEITSYSNQLCKKLNKKFDCSITTNGTLLNDVRIKELHKAGVTHYQITIDGIKADHDKIKRLKSVSAYETVLKNINLLPGYSTCALRFNYTRKNTKPDQIISELNQRLSKEAKKNLILSIERVWQEQEDRETERKIEYLCTIARDSGIFPVIHRFDMCYADKPSFNCIFPNGKIGKCDNDGMDKVPAHIEVDGQIIWPDGLKYTIPAIFDNKSECYSCKYLPVCWGPCPAKRKRMLQRQTNISCFLPDKDRMITERIIQANFW